MSSAVVFGGYGVFGLHVSRELARRGLRVTVAGRDRASAEKAAWQLGPGHRGLAADVTDRAACRDVLTGHAVAVNCAGGFSDSGESLLEACLEAGCHYVDIADDRGHAARVRSWGPRYREARRCAVYGCSSLPGLSGALALLAHEGMTPPPIRARVSLFIGNNNPKGLAAIRSLVACLGLPIKSPQGLLHGFRDREVVPLPPPFGPRAGYNFESPEYDLFPELLGTESLTVKVGFERGVVNVALAILARLPLRYGDMMARALAMLGRLTPGSGSSGGVVMTELFDSEGQVRRAAAVAQENGQRMAALPCAMVTAFLSKGASTFGAFTAYELLGAREVLAQVENAGFSVVGPSRT